jgi:hypothetical protein
VLALIAGAVVDRTQEEGRIGVRDLGESGRLVALRELANSRRGPL